MGDDNEWYGEGALNRFQDADAIDEPPYRCFTCGRFVGRDMVCAIHG